MSKSRRHHPPVPATPRAAAAAPAEMPYRGLIGPLGIRAEFAKMAGLTFGGKRDVFEALGYNKTLTPADYRLRYKRNAVAARVVETMPKASWRGGAELVENEDPETETTFELAWEALAKRIDFWAVMQRADILAGVGRYSVIWIGVKGETKLDAELPKTFKADDIIFFAPYGEDEMEIQSFVEDTSDPRFGLPLLYQFKRINSLDKHRTAIQTANSNIVVHWSRVIHFIDNVLDDRVFGQPRLERVWNLLDDLEKITGGGAESSWKRANQGLHIDMDPTITITKDALEKLDKEVEEYEHTQNKTIRTRGVKVNTLGSDVSVFSANCDAVIAQISAGSEIPQRILTGTESGELGSSQDRSNWNDRVQDRRKNTCERYVRQFVDLCIEHKALPTPTEYQAVWPTEESMTEVERIGVVGQLATANASQAGATGEALVTSDELRDLYLHLPPLSEVADDADDAVGGRVAMPEPEPLPGADGTTEAKPTPARKRAAISHLRSAKLRMSVEARNRATRLRSLAAYVGA